MVKTVRAARILGIVAVAALSTGSLAGQGYRGEVRATGQILELRPLVRDSLPESEVAGEGIRRRLPDGTIATCVPAEFCRWYQSGAAQGLSVQSQELRLTAWGGMPGLSARVHLRGRYGSDELWPATTQRLEAVTAYADLDRADFRARAGRIARADALGYYNFDGATFLWRGFAPAWVEVYAGWSLARGLNAPRTGMLLEEADDLPPDDRGLLLGAQAGARVGPVSGTIAYQRDIRTDRLAIYAERVALDLRALLGAWALDASAEVDWASLTLNELRLRGTGRLTSAFEATVEGRHYEPFFESWTIWGAFTPVGFNEGRAAVLWRPAPSGLHLEVSGAYRDYEDTRAQLEFAPVREDGWRASASVGWDRAGWRAAATYRADVGPGAARFGADLSGEYAFAPGRRVALHASRTQTFGELRLNEQFVSGLGVDVSWRIGELDLIGGASLYRLDGRERPADEDWTQGRIHAGAAFRFGRDPGPRS